MKRWWIGLGSAIALTALAVSVHLGLLNTVDLTIRQWARPGDVWGTAQVRADLVVEGLRPTVLATLLVAFTLACSVKRRSLRPAVFVGCVGVVTVALTLALKVAVGRLNTHGVLGNGGSFPSGHIIAIIVCLGLGILVAQPCAGRWLWLIPAFGGGLMGASLVLQAAHWSTDVVGGGLLATALLAVTTASGATRWMHNEWGNDHESAASGRRNRTSSLTLVGPARTWIARLNSAVPDSALSGCYDPARGKLVLRSYGGL